MSGGVGLSQALQLISGVPLQKVGSVFAEKLSITKRLDGGGGLAGLIGQVLKDGNLSAIMQNPVAGAIQGIQGQLGGLVSQLSGVAGSAGLVTALTGAGGLGNALSSLQAAGDNLAGLTNGAAGFFAMLGHANTADMAGAALPAAAGLAAVTAPLTAGNFLGTLSSGLQPLVSQVVSGAVTPDAATTWVQAQVQTVGSLVAGSAGALAYGAQIHPLVATVASVAGALAVPPTFDAEGYRVEGRMSSFQGVLSTLVQPQSAAQITAAIEAQIAHVKHAPVDVASFTSIG